MKLFFARGERKVEYVELVYDLIFVYLVSRNTSLLETTEGGFITMSVLLTYLASSMAILQIWYVGTLYINHYGDGSLREHLMLFVNMYMMYFMAEGIRKDWGPVYFRYNAAWSVILLNMALQFYLTGRKQTEDIFRLHCRRYSVMLLIEAGIVIASIPIYSYTGYAFSPWALVFAAILLLATRGVEGRLPANFPHLAERVMLYIVFTFGEMVLGITGYFDDGLSAETFYYSAMAFAIVVGLFSGYGHYYNHLMDPDTQTVGTDYMALHIVMLLALNNITVALIFMQRAWVLALPKTLFLVVSIFVYYLCLLATQKYAKYRIKRVGMFYGGFFAVFAVYAAAMLLTSRLPMLNIGLTAAFIYLQLYMLHYGGKTLHSGEEIITGGSDE